MDFNIRVKIIHIKVITVSRTIKGKEDITVYIAIDQTEDKDNKIYVRTQ